MTLKKTSTRKSSSTKKELSLEDIKIDIKCKNKKQKDLIEAVKDSTITICNGSAGTGKTYLTCAQSLKELKHGNFKKIVIVKSVIPVKDEEIGFIKGDLKEKMSPYLASFENNFEKLIGDELYKYLCDNNYIKNIPIAFMRGVSIDDAIIIVDEAQNLTGKKLMTIMTRLGENSKMIFLGDSNQIDMKIPSLSGLKDMLYDFKNIEGFATVEFSEEDCVRHEIVKKILQRVDELPESSKSKYIG